MDSIWPTDGRRFWTDGLDWRLDNAGLPMPRFTVSEVAKVFFARGPDWLRWRHGSSHDFKHPDGWFVLDGQPLEPRRTAADFRYYTLLDIEMMGFALAEQDVLPVENLAALVQMVRCIAFQHGYVADPGTVWKRALD